MKKRIIPIILSIAFLLTACGEKPIDRVRSLINEAITVETDYLRSKKDRDGTFDKLNELFHKIDEVQIDDVHENMIRLDAMGYINDFNIACIGKEEDQRMIEARNNMQALLDGDEE